MLQFSRNMCFKRAKFCIIQRRVKCRCILPLQIFSFLLRWLLTLVKVHIMLCTFRNGTTKILTLNMFKRFFFSFLFDMVLRTVIQKFCKVWRPVLQKFCMVWCLMLQKFCKVWRPKRAKILHALKSSAAEILHSMTSTAAEILQAMTSWVKEKFYVLQGSMLQKFWVVAFPFSKKTNCRGPTHTNSFDQFSFLCFFYFSVIIVEITILCMLMFSEWRDKLVKITPRLAMVKLW